MFAKKAKHALCTAILGAVLLQGCATRTPPAPPPEFAVGQTIEYEGFLITVNSARSAVRFRNWVNQLTRAGDNFVIVSVDVVNKTGVPVPAHLQPVFRLIDSSGAIYERSIQHTMMINMGKTGRPTPGMSINPNVNINQEIVFEAPRQKTYKLQSIIPNRASVGFAGSVTSSGPYFNVDLSPQLQIAQGSDSQ